MTKVFVMLSSYNGDKYIERQINSILGQKDVNVQLYIRDDGSSDNTVAILNRYSSEYDNVHIVCSENVGYIKSFMWLVKNVPLEKDAYYSFSDQDDIWDSDKLSSAIYLLSEQKEQDKPLLYYSDLKVVDETEQFIKMANTWEGNIDKYMLSVFIGIRGCTMVYNDILQDLLIKYDPGKISGHDTYIALVAFWTGIVVYDKNAYINYRQTGNNLSITGVNRFDKLKKNFLYVKKRMTVRANIHENNAKEVLTGFSDYIKDKEELQLVADYKKSLKNKMALLTYKKYKFFSFPIRVFNAFFILIGKL